MTVVVTFEVKMLHDVRCYILFPLLVSTFCLRVTFIFLVEILQACQLVTAGEYAHNVDRPMLQSPLLSRPNDRPDHSASSSQRQVSSAPLTIYYQNVRGLRTKTNQLYLSLSSSDYDVIAFSETWLNGKILNSELSSEYNIYRADRNPGTSGLERGGGVLIGVKKRFHPKPVHLQGDERLEQIAVRIPLSGKTLFVCCVYIPPNSEASIYTQHSSCVQQLCDLAQSTDDVVVVGDYNVPNLTWHFDEDFNAYLPSGQSTEQEVALIEDVLGTGLQQVFDLPNANGRLLDLALVSDSSRFLLIEPPRAILKIDVHHRPFILVYDTQTLEKTAEEQAGTYYDFANCDTAALNNSIASLDWPNLLLTGSVDDIVARFYEHLNEIIRAVVPLKHRRPSPQNRQPWWNRETRNLRNRVRKARKRFIKHTTDILGRELAELELQYEVSLEAAFREYINGIETDLKREPKSFWAFVRKRKQNNGIPQDMVYQDSSTSTPENAVQLFADFFKTVYSTDQPSPNSESLDTILANEFHLPLLRFSEEEVRKALDSTDASKGPGPDNLPPAFVKHCATSLATPLAIIFNRSLESGVFPAKWKLASITPVHKSGNVHNVENYRSISILSCLPKVFEKMVHGTLSRVVQPIISDCQHGFMAKRSTTTNLMTFVTDVLRTMESRCQVDAVYVDFAKAFDRVPHRLAIEKMRRLGLPEWILAWLHSYLTSRSAYVKINGSKSDLFMIPSGVPQGSHLGPLIFLLFINDLCHWIKNDKVLYADDLKFYRKVSSSLDCLALQSDINSLMMWCEQNGMEANAKKCQVITFDRKLQPIMHSYTMGGSLLGRVCSVKDLGVTLDRKMTFNEHVTAVTAKAFATLGFMRRNTTAFKDIHALKALYSALIRSQLEYAAQVWAPYHNVHIVRLERVQRAFVRLALRTLPWRNPPEQTPIEDRRRLLGLDTLLKRRQRMQQMFIFDLLTKRLDSQKLSRHLNVYVPPRILRRNPPLFRIPFHQTSYGYNQPFDVCCRLFNVVSDRFVFTMSKDSFKKMISL